MFNRKEKKFKSELNKVLTTTGLLKAAIAQDNDTMMAMVTGKTADDEGMRFALETLLLVAHRNPPVIARLRELSQQMPPKADQAFATGIQAAEVGSVRMFQGGNVVGQGLFIISMAAAISEDNSALADAMATLKMYSEGS